ncbi:MAG: hypothetical protein ACOC7W_04390 [Desulfosalsimonas sp.]
MSVHSFTSLVFYGSFSGALHTATGEKSFSGLRAASFREAGLILLQATIINIFFRALGDFTPSLAIQSIGA